jgi:hypothetical protein
VPQDIPLEASETLVFTPECLAGLESPPTFTLRTATPRDKRHQRLLLNEEGVRRHSVEQLRREMLAGLKELWGEDAYAQHAPVVEAYWAAGDEFALQQRDDPDLKWEYDPDIEAAVQKLEADVAQSWRPFAKMRAANAYSGDISLLTVAAVMIVRWTGLKHEPVRERGYLTIDSIDSLREDLPEWDEKAKADRGTSWAQLLAACTMRMFLTEDAEKNSASPSPSETPPPTSKTAGSAKAGGKSPVPASSPKIRERA